MSLRALKKKNEKSINAAQISGFCAESPYAMVSVYILVKLHQRHCFGWVSPSKTVPVLVPVMWKVGSLPCRIRHLRHCQCRSWMEGKPETNSRNMREDRAHDLWKKKRKRKNILLSLLPITINMPRNEQIYRYDSDDFWCNHHSQWLEIGSTNHFLLKLDFFFSSTRKARKWFICFGFIKISHNFDEWLSRSLVYFNAREYADRWNFICLLLDRMIGNNSSKRLKNVWLQFLRLC